MVYVRCIPLQAFFSVPRFIIQSSFSNNPGGNFRLLPHTTKLQELDPFNAAKTDQFISINMQRRKVTHSLGNK